MLVGEIVRQLEYKALWFGRTLVKIDRWYPVSKTCAGCGCVLAALDLEEREWTCPQCGEYHDRDTNAAQNILVEGLRQSAAGQAVAAWGGGVSPNPNGNRGRYPPMNQELSLVRAGESLGFQP
jgi:putative transposase